MRSTSIGNKTRASGRWIHSLQSWGQDEQAVDAVCSGLTVSSEVQYVGGVEGERMTSVTKSTGAESSALPTRFLVSCC